MRKSGLNILRFCAGVIACASLSALDVAAQDYPARPLHILVGFSPGGAVDYTARLVGQKLSESLGQPVIIDNRPGSATAIATERAAKSPPDGYTLLLIPISTPVLSALRSKLPYDLKRDLAPVSLVSIGPFVMVVHPSLPARTVKEFIALARSQPGKIDYGSPGLGGANHLATELFGSAAKIKMVHVPYKGSSDAVMAAATGEAPMSFSSVAGALPLLSAGRLRALAVTSAKRVSTLASVPTLDEAGLPGFDYSAWYGVSVPAGVPKNIIMRLNAEIGKLVQLKDVRGALNKQGFEPQSGSPEQFGALISREIERTSKLIKTIGLKIE